MGGELQFPRTPARDLDYWLGRCEGFDVHAPEGRVGTVEGLRFRTRVDRPDALAVRTGLLRRVVIIPVGAVEAIAPDAQDVRLSRAPWARAEGSAPVAATSDGARGGRAGARMLLRWLRASAQRRGQ